MAGTNASVDFGVIGIEISTGQDEPVYIRAKPARR
jgi:hypothetical protein